MILADDGVFIGEIRDDGSNDGLVVRSLKGLVFADVFDHLESIDKGDALHEVIRIDGTADKLFVVYVAVWLLMDNDARIRAIERLKDAQKADTVLSGEREALLFAQTALEKVGDDVKATERMFVTQTIREFLCDRDEMFWFWFGDDETSIDWDQSISIWFSAQESRR